MLRAMRRWPRPSLPLPKPARRSPMPPRAKFGMGNAALLSRTATRATSLFGDDGRSLREIDVDCIKPNPNQPRRHFDEAALRGLQDSIEKHGLLQPVCVREVAADRFQLIAGE